MLGAIVGDFAGSTREFQPIKVKDFALFEAGSTVTDDTVMTLAVAHAFLDGLPLVPTLKRYVQEYPAAGYGQAFFIWARGPEDAPYGSWGNGAAMRVSSCAWLGRDLAHAVDLARRSAEVTHDHPEGIRGAEATAAAIYLARCGLPMSDIASIVTAIWAYDLTPAIADIRRTATFELKSEISVPQALCCAFQAESFEDAIRNAISLGGDADTQAAIAGAIGEGAWGVPRHLGEHVLSTLPREFLDVIARASSSALDPVRPTDADLMRIERWKEDAGKRYDDAKAARDLLSLDTWTNVEKAFKAAPARATLSFMGSVKRLLGAGS